MKVLYIGADFCQPCKAMKPIVATAQENGYDIEYFDAEERKDIVEQYNVRSVPTFVKVKGGVEESRLIGAIPPSVFMKWLEG